MDDLISREKAYEVLSDYYHHKTEMQHKALREALDRVPSAELQPTCNKLATSCNQLATDCISRQAAIEAIDEIESEVADGDGFQYDKWRRHFCDLPSAEPESCEYWDAESNYCALNRPSAEPERKTGKWLEREVIHAKEAKAIITEWQSCKCSVCGCYDTRPYLYCFNEPRFCSWCGADMKGETDVKG